MGTLAAAGAIFYGISMQAVAKGRRPPRLPTAKDIGGRVARQLRDRYLKETPTHG